MSFGDCRVKSTPSTENLSADPLDVVLFARVMMNGLEFIYPRSVTCASLLKSLTMSVTFPSCVGRGSVEPASAQREDMAKVLLPTPLLQNTFR